MARFYDLLFFYLISIKMLIPTIIIIAVTDVIVSRGLVSCFTLCMLVTVPQSLG